MDPIGSILRAEFILGLNTLTAAIVYTVNAQPARHGNTSRPKKLRELREWV